MKKFFLSILLLSLLLTGCHNIALNYNATSNAECVKQCYDDMNNHFCDGAGAIPSFKDDVEIRINNNEMSNTTLKSGCDCALMNCIKNIN